MFRLLLLLLPLFLLGCFPYVYYSQDRVLIPKVDVPATLEIAEIELAEEGFDATLTIWAIRDQVITVEQARTISQLYFRYADRIASQPNRRNADFGTWHLTWAIANLYRNGSAGVRTELKSAYLDAKERPKKLKHFKGAAEAHVNGQRIIMGDIHGFARAFARSHVVVPGNPRYLQSLQQYLKTKGSK